MISNFNVLAGNCARASVLLTWSARFGSREAPPPTGSHSRRTEHVRVQPLAPVTGDAPHARDHPARDGHDETRTLPQSTGTCPASSTPSDRMHASAAAPSAPTVSPVLQVHDGLKHQPQLVVARSRDADPPRGSRDWPHRRRAHANTRPCARLPVRFAAAERDVGLA